MGYIYSYVNKLKNNKTYIGSRRVYEGTPEEDFNIKYFSSSKNPEFLEDLKARQLEGHIILEVSDPEECVKLENLMIKAYWEQYGKENSYNLHYSIGKEKQFIASKGWHHSEESKKKISEHSYSRTDEWRKYCRELWTGDKNPMKNDETKAKISKALSGRKKSDDEKRNISVRTKEGMAKMSNEDREKLRYWKYHKQSEESRRKLSESLKKVEHTEEWNKKVSEAKKGKTIPKHKWLTPSGEIKEMDIANAHKWHPDWKLYEK